MLKCKTKSKGSKFNIKHIKHTSRNNRVLLFKSMCKKKVCVVQHSNWAKGLE